MDPIRGESFTTKIQAQSKSQARTKFQEPIAMVSWSLVLGIWFLEFGSSFEIHISPLC
jgi:hypothetical protein